jgi:hypothetical protein
MKMTASSSSQASPPDPPNKAIIDPFDARSLQVQPVSYIDNDPPTEFFCMLRSHKNLTILFISVLLQRFEI